MKRSAKVRSVKRGYKESRRDARYVGRTADGVLILRPKAKPKHFTSNQIRKAILKVESSLSD